VETSGWPKDVDTEEKKEQYKKEYKDKFEIELGEITDNPGMRHIAKLCL
jgi:hypothetical protein